MDTAKYIFVFILLIQLVISWKIESFVADFYNSESVNYIGSTPNVCKVMCKNEPCLAKMIKTECEFLPMSESLVKASPQSSKAIMLWVSDQIEFGKKMSLYLIFQIHQSLFLQFTIS